MAAAALALRRQGAAEAPDGESRRADIATLPYRAELLEWIRAEHASGRRIVLCSASDAKFAEKVADHLGLFHEVMASERGRIAPELLQFLC